MAQEALRSEVAIVGGGLAGLVTALELLERGKRVTILDRDVEERLGGLARESFGGMFFVDTPHQRRLGIRDSADLALRDWLSFAELGPGDAWPRRWAEEYTARCREEVFDWLTGFGIGFFPVVHWVERGLFRPGNSVPRFHMVWGTGSELVAALVGRLRSHPSAGGLDLRFRHRVTDLEERGGRVAGVRGTDEETGRPFSVEAEHVVLASGGICGSIERLRRHWFAAWGEAPATILNGSHRYADGEMHDAAAAVGANLTHLDKQWSYAAGVHHPSPGGMPDRGLSLVPPKSALWVNAHGERIGPVPLVAGYDTRYLVEQVARQPGGYSWQVMNWRIAKKELAVSGSEFNDAIREKRRVAFLKTALLGNEPLVRTLVERCPDFVVADSLEALVERMNALSGDDAVRLDSLRETISAYDAVIDRGESLHNDEQLRRIAHLRRYRGDRVRTCRFQKILDPSAMPLLAIREFVLSRKSLGGIQTDLGGRVLSGPAAGDGQEPIPGLYAVGEAAGFGGGGSHGLRALEGTFLGTCVLTGRIAARTVAGG